MEEPVNTINRAAGLRVAIQQVLDTFYPESRGDVVTDVVMILEVADDENHVGYTHISSTGNLAKDVGLALALHMRSTALLTTGWAPDHD